MRGALLGSLGSSLDSAAHLASFFMSVRPEVPMEEMASALFSALERKVAVRVSGPRAPAGRTSTSAARQAAGSLLLCFFLC